MHTRRPTQDRDAYVDVTVGDLNLIKVSGAVNFSLSDNIAMRATLFSSQRDGYVDDIALGKDVYNDRDRIGARLQLLYEPSDDFNMRIIADYAEIVAQRIGPPEDAARTAWAPPPDWPRPGVAAPPWNRVQEWIPDRAVAHG